MTPDQHSLLSDLERATEGSRELDGRIWAAAEPEAMLQRCEFKGMYVYSKAEKALHIRQHAEWFAQPYTTRLDAALTLADPDWWLQLRHQRSGEGEKWCVCFFELTEDPYVVSARAKTFPLAVTAAALRARWS